MFLTEVVEEQLSLGGVGVHVDSTDSIVLASSTFTFASSVEVKARALWPFIFVDGFIIPMAEDVELEDVDKLIVAILGS